MDILGKVLDKHYEGKWNSFHAPTGTMADFENIDWIGDKPSKSDFQTQYDAEEQAYNNSQYQRDRAEAYDPIPEQLDQIFWDMDGWKAKIKSVKDKFPKPS